MQRINYTYQSETLVVLTRDRKLLGLQPGNKAALQGPQFRSRFFLDVSFDGIGVKCRLLRNQRNVGPHRFQNVRKSDRRGSNREVMGILRILNGFPAGKIGSGSWAICMVLVLPKTYLL